MRNSTGLFLPKNMTKEFNDKQFSVPGDLVKLFEDFNKLESLYKAASLFNLGMDANVLNEYRYFARGLVDLLHCHAKAEIHSVAMDKEIKEARDRVETAYSVALCDTIDNVHLYVRSCINTIKINFPTFSISKLIGKEIHEEALNALEWIGKEISRSRENRAGRKEIYQAIAESNELQNLLNLAHKFPIIEAAAADYPRKESAEDWLDKISGALEDKKITLYYQPKREVSTGKVIGAEALLRWTLGKTPEGDPIFLPPVFFIPRAEASGAIHVLGSFVLTEACKVLARWQEMPAFENLTLSVNVSPTQLTNPDFSSDLNKLMERYQTRPAYLELEITEDVLIRDKNMAACHIHNLKACNFSIDDFGKGSTEFDYLAHFPIETIKIDRSILENAIRHNADCEDESSEEPKKNRHKLLITGIVGLARGVEADVVLEGVEREIGLQIAKDAGISTYQGYYDGGEPMTLDSFETFVKDRNKNP